MLERPEPGRIYGKAKPPVNDPELASNYPSLYAYLTQDRWPDGNYRLTSTITVFVDGGALTVVLNDRDNNRSAFANEASLHSALAALDSAITDDTIEWRSRKSQATKSDSVPF